VRLPLQLPAYATGFLVTQLIATSHAHAPTTAGFAPVDSYTSHTHNSNLPCSGPYVVCCYSPSLLAGFTHLQQAQTVRWGHWLMSHAAAWQRDDMRLRDLLPRVATLPLGSGALAGMEECGA
jgi:hypothetical protein